MSIGGLTKYLTLPVVKDVKIPLPEMAIQTKVTSDYSRELDFLNSIKDVITIFERKIKDFIAKVWGE